MDSGQRIGRHSKLRNLSFVRNTEHQMSTYLATVTDDNHVIVTIDGIEVDRPGPWDTSEGAHLWAADIVASLEAGNLHYPQQPGWPDGN
jgi:hypothetical protein